VDAGAESGTAAGFTGGRSLSSFGRESKSAKWALDGGPSCTTHHPHPRRMRVDTSQAGSVGRDLLRYLHAILPSSDQRNLACRPPNINPVKRSLVEDTDAAAPPLIGFYRHARPSLEFLPLSTISLSHKTRKKDTHTKYTCVCVRGETFTGCFVHEKCSEGQMCCRVTQHALRHPNSRERPETGMPNLAGHQFLRRCCS
jgi:hypothetical protein